jgi:hypothetical protein
MRIVPGGTGSAVGAEVGISVAVEVWLAVAVRTGVRLSSSGVAEGAADELGEAVSGGSKLGEGKAVKEGVAEAVVEGWLALAVAGVSEACKLVVGAGREAVSSGSVPVTATVYVRLALGVTWG